MLQQDDPDDYVVATGETHQVRDFVRMAFEVAGIDDWQSHVRHDPKFLRPAEVDMLVGDPSKALGRLGWAREASFAELVEKMVAYDLAIESRDSR